MAIGKLRVNNGEPMSFMDEEARQSIEELSATIGDINTILASVV